MMIVDFWIYHSTKNEDVPSLSGLCFLAHKQYTVGPKANKANPKKDNSAIRDTTPGGSPSLSVLNQREEKQNSIHTCGMMGTALRPKEHNMLAS
jgi:hypothetical protein